MRAAAPPFLLLLLLLLAARAPPASAARFACNAAPRAACQALAGYVPANSTTYAAIKSLFAVKSLRVLFGANGLPLSTRPSLPVPAGSTVRVPFPCLCSNTTGASARRPLYKVKAGDTLDAIARTVFDGLVTYKEIATANNVSDPASIRVGEELWVPLPCSCDPVGGERVVHYAHLVAPGSSVAEIAAEFGTSEETLLQLNGIGDPTSLQAGQVLDVPLQACSSSISPTAVDRNLRIANGSYVLTANNCVLCSCSSSTWQLDCHPTQGVSKSICPPAMCGSLPLGNTSSSSACEVTSCAYGGYINKTAFTILSNLTTQSLCNNSQPSSKSTPKLDLQALNWINVVIFLHLGLVCFSFLRHKTS